MFSKIFCLSVYVCVCVWTFPAHLFQWDKLALIALLPEHDFSVVPSGFLWPHY